MIDSKYHAARLAGLLLLAGQFKKAKGEKERREIFGISRKIRCFGREFCG
ncbi:MAG: hypothetical protein LBH19_12390 [Dysgonamonadaceae bacterium]|nr:hypothetical protein [Dysgonamonadaceae bacterium]